MAELLLTSAGLPSSGFVEATKIAPRLGSLLTVGFAATLPVRLVVILDDS